MAIIKKTGIPYEILVRFNFGGEHQTAGKVGEFEGAHYVEAEVIIDDETNEVIQFKPGMPQPLPEAAAISQLLGERFVELERQIRTLRAAHIVAVAERNQLIEAVEAASKN